MQMTRRRRYEGQYCQREMEVLTNWMQTGQNGLVIGLVGVGLSSFLNYFCFYPDARTPYFEKEETKKYLVALLDCELLPETDLPTLYRALYDALQDGAAAQGLELTVTNESLIHMPMDAYSTQKRLLDLLAWLRNQDMRVVIVLDHFHALYDSSTADLVAKNLRRIRDRFKQHLFYLIGVSQLPNPAEERRLEPLMQLVGLNRIWLKGLTRPDTDATVLDHLEEVAEEVSPRWLARIYELTGGYPALVKGTAVWLRSNFELAESQWLPALQNDLWLNERLTKLVAALTETERQQLQLLAQQEMQVGDNASLLSLQEKGLVTEAGQIAAQLLETYVAGRVIIRPRPLVFDEQLNKYRVGETVLELTPTETKLLDSFYRCQEILMTDQRLIQEVWDVNDGHHTFTQSLAKQVSNLKKKLNAIPLSPIIEREQNRGYIFRVSNDNRNS